MRQGRAAARALCAHLPRARAPRRALRVRARSNARQCSGALAARERPPPSSPRRRPSCPSCAAAPPSLRTFSTRPRATRRGRPRQSRPGRASAPCGILTSRPPSAPKRGAGGDGVRRARELMCARRVWGARAARRAREYGSTLGAAGGAGAGAAATSPRLSCVFMRAGGGRLGRFLSRLLHAAAVRSTSRKSESARRQAS